MKPYTPGGNADSVVALTDCSRAAFLKDPWYQARNIESRPNGFSSLSSIFALASLAQGIRLAFFNLEYSTTGIDSGSLKNLFPRLQNPEVWVRCDWFMPILLTGVCVCWHPNRIHQMLWEATTRCTTALQAVQFVHRRAHNPDTTDLTPCDSPNFFWFLSRRLRRLRSMTPAKVTRTLRHRISLPRWCGWYHWSTIRWIPSGTSTGCTGQREDVSYSRHCSRFPTCFRIRPLRDHSWTTVTIQRCSVFADTGNLLMRTTPSTR